MKGNSVSIKGNLTRNAEVRGASGDRACVSFGLAWNNNRLRADNTLQDQVHYFEVSCWMSPGQQKYFMPQLMKGATCSIIDGYLSYDTWRTKEGDKRSRVEISVVDPVSSMILLAPRKASREEQKDCQEYADSAIPDDRDQPTPGGDDEDSDEAIAAVKKADSNDAEPDSPEGFDNFKESAAAEAEAAEEPKAAKKPQK